MAEERMRVTVTFEYSINPAHYPETSSPAERAEVERDCLLDDPNSLAETFLLSRKPWRITVTPMSVTSPEGKTT